MNPTHKAAEVSRLIEELNDDLSTNTLSNVRRRSNLEQLKVHGRDPTGADAIYCKSGITTLTSYAFGTYNSDVVQEALRVIANALILRPTLQATFLESNGLPPVARLYQHQDNNFEFLGARILFVCTYAPVVDFTNLFVSEKLLESIEQHLARHAAQASSPTGLSNPVEMMALIETTKLIFNLNNKHPKECEPLSTAVPDLCTILQFCGDATPMLDPPTGPILNALACLDFGAVPARSSDDEAQNKHQDLVARLTHILERSIEQYKPTQLDTFGLSTITILRMIYDTASTEVRTEMRKLLLPADSERDLPLGKSSTLASKLLRLTTSPGLNHISEAISSLLFEMSDRDATTFVKNIGYGYAAGYLMTHKIPVPESVKAGSALSADAGQIPVNPVTGQRLDKEAVPDVPEMTPEEKEREAERMFVLFERLRATGVVTAENPVRKAMEEGRLTEVPDSDSD